MPAHRARPGSNGLLLGLHPGEVGVRVGVLSFGLHAHYVHKHCPWLRTGLGGLLELELVLVVLQPVAAVREQRLPPLLLLREKGNCSDGGTMARNSFLSLRVPPSSFRSTGIDAALVRCGAMQSSPPPSRGVVGPPDGRLLLPVLVTVKRDVTLERSVA